MTDTVAVTVGAGEDFAAASVLSAPESPPVAPIPTPMRKRTAAAGMTMRFLAQRGAPPGPCGPNGDGCGGGPQGGGCGDRLCDRVPPPKVVWRDDRNQGAEREGGQSSASDGVVTIT